MSSILGKKVFGAATGATSTASKSSTGGAQSFASAYYQRYIATSSAAPIFHGIAFYSALHWTITQAHKHKYQTKKVYH